MLILNTFSSISSTVHHSLAVASMQLVGYVDLGDGDSEVVILTSDLYSVLSNTKDLQPAFKAGVGNVSIGCSGIPNE